MPARSSRDRSNPDRAAGEARASESGRPAARGEAAWRASVAEIAKRNDAARAAGARRRAAKDDEAAVQAARFARREARDFPQPPH